MKKTVYFLLLNLFFFLFTAPANSFQAVKQFEETSYYLKDVCFLSMNNGWAVGEPHWDQDSKEYRGTIIRTIDGGETWVAQDSPVSYTFRGVVFVDENNGWVAGANGTILHTNNGGSTWATQDVNTDEEFMGVDFSDRYNGWAVSIVPTHYDGWDEADDWQSTVWHTTDGGATWVKQSLPENVSLLNRIRFINGKDGWVVGTKLSGYNDYGDPEHAGVVYGTADGGATWTEIYDAGADIALKAVDFVDSDTGWVAGFPTLSSLPDDGYVFHTSDGGDTWEKQEPGGIYSPIWDIQFIDRDRGYAVGFDYIGAWGPPVWRTMDGGTTWEKIRMARHDNDGLFGVTVVEDQVVAVGDHDFIAKSIDAWKSCHWSYPEETCYNCDCLFEQFYINSHYQFEDIFFTDENNGWAVGSRSYLPDMLGQVIFSTTDGGDTWNIQYEQAPDLDSLFSVFRLDSVHFTDDRNGWSVGISIYEESDPHWSILATQDGGLTWNEQGLELDRNWNWEFFDVQFLDSLNGWCLVDNLFPEEDQYMAHTTDGGNTWEWVSTGVPGSMSVGYETVLGGLDFTDSLNGWAVGGLGEILHTVDGGATWSQQELDCGYPSCDISLYAIDMINDQEGWIAGRELYHTTDGGNQWQKASESFSVDFHDIQFLDRNNGWLVGDAGTIVYTENTGSNWNLVESGTAVTLKGLSFINAQRGWVAGNYGTILSISEDSTQTTAQGFDYSAYLSANADLPPEWGKEECMNHYKIFGFWENRAVSFSLDEYLNANPDLPKTWTYSEALSHYYVFGINEKRLLAFDAQEYLSLYPDLPQDWSYEQAYNHYVYFGKSEGRIPSFDETAYLELYSDLPSSWTQTEAFYHYVQLGKYEGRVYDPYDEDVFLTD